jgi:flagellar basal body-associated protein FliL
MGCKNPFFKQTNKHKIMNIYLIIYFVLHFLSLGMVMAKHGQKQESNHNFFTSLISLVISWTLLYLSGIFNNL